MKAALLALLAAPSALAQVDAYSPCPRVSAKSLGLAHSVPT